MNNCTMVMSKKPKSVTKQNNIYIKRFSKIRNKQTSSGMFNLERNEKLERDYF